MSATAFTEETIREVFLRLDTSGDGFLSYVGRVDGLSGCGLDWNAHSLRHARAAGPSVEASATGTATGRCLSWSSGS